MCILGHSTSTQGKTVTLIGYKELLTRQSGGDFLKRLGCRDVGGDCDFITTGETAEEVKMALFVHAQEAHKDMLANMSPEELSKIIEKIDGILSKQ